MISRDSSEIAVEIVQLWPMAQSSTRSSHVQRSKEEEERKDSRESIQSCLDRDWMEDESGCLSMVENCDWKASRMRLVLEERRWMMHSK